MTYEIIYTDELYHHGIKGQKWGTRRWQNEDGTFNAAGKERYFGKTANKYQTKADKYGERFKNSKTFIGRGINNRLQAKNQYKANVAKSLNESKNFKEKVSNVLGAGRRKSAYDASRQYYENKASVAKTRLGKTLNESSAYNMKQMSKAESKVMNSKNITQYVKNSINRDYNTPLKTVVGRTTTVGKESVKALLTGPLYTVVATVEDVAYYAKSGSKEKSNSK